MVYRHFAAIAALIVLGGCPDFVQSENPCVEPLGVGKLEMYLEPPVTVTGGKLLLGLL